MESFFAVSLCMCVNLTESVCPQCRSKIQYHQPKLQTDNTTPGDGHYWSVCHPELKQRYGHTVAGRKSTTKTADGEKYFRDWGNGLTVMNAIKDLLSSSSFSPQAWITASVSRETDQHCLAQTSVQLIIEKMTNRSGSAMRVTEQDTLRDRGRKKSQSHRDRSCDCECNDFKTYLFLEIRRKEICGVNNCLHLKRKQCL